MAIGFSEIEVELLKMSAKYDIPSRVAQTASKAASRFEGPLFIVGMPRSGTKLLRAILNEHPQVAIPNTETEFLPWWVANWNRFGDLSDERMFEEFYNKCQQLPFFIYLRDANRPIDWQGWYRRCREFSPGAVFEALIREHLALQPGDGILWGDKSPSYLTHLELLRRLYPQARFLHIIRDVRDYCLSINKAWGKHVLRAAQRWADDVASGRAAGARLGGAYLEIRYEDLLHDPPGTIRRVCKFAAIAYDDSLLDLSRVTENIGDAKGLREISRSNVGKFATGLRPATRAMIESLAAETLRQAGYPCEYRGRPRRLSFVRLKYYQAMDGINLIRFSARERGLGGALRFVLRYFVVSGNRRKVDS